MLFNSYEFILVFLPISLLFFFILGRYFSTLYAIFFLVSSSLFFYGWWNPSYLLLISGSILFNYIIGLNITRYNQMHDDFKSLVFLIIGIAFNLSLLVYYKYSDFFLDSFNNVAGFDWHLQYLILPIGISFFTFQQIAYLVDTRKNKTNEHNFLHYCLFVVFFPQLIAGPIVHHRQMLPQFSNAKTYLPSFENFSVGLSIFIIGLFKKVVLADNLAIYANPVFDIAETGQVINFLQAWIATLAYTLQLYFDFSGYSDMAIGLARLFGIKLPINFYSPYKATSIIDFWQRWHMTLSTFLKDYVYIPLGGNRKGSKRRYLNLLLTMLIGGLWHGAAWTFVAWGALHGFFIIINHLWRKLGFRAQNNCWYLVFSRLLTMIFISLTWVLFRADSFSGAVQIYKGMFNLPVLLLDKLGNNVNLLSYIGFRFTDYNVRLLDGFIILMLLLGFIAVWLLPNTQEIMSRFKPAYDFDEKSKQLVCSCFQINLIWKPTLIWALFISILFVSVLLNLTHVSEFLYFQF